MIKDKINNTIEQLNKQFTDFQNKIKSVKALTIYSQEEINRRTEAIYKKPFLLLLIILKKMLNRVLTLRLIS